MVRIFIYNEAADEREVFFERVKAADELRRITVGGDNYRAVFGEADLLPGLVVDRYADVLSVQFLTLGTDTVGRRKCWCVKALSFSINFWQSSHEIHSTG